MIGARGARVGRTRMPHRLWSGLAILAAVPLIVSGSCPKKPPVTAIEIVPAEVVVGPDLSTARTFKVEARLWTGPAADRRSITEAQGYDNLDWKSDQPWLTVLDHARFDATLQIGAGVAPSLPAYVTVKAGGKTSPGAKVSVAPSTIAGQDVLTAAYKPGKAADAAVVNGLWTSSSSCERAFSPFVTRWMVGNLVNPCGGIDAGWGAAVLAVDHQVVFTPVAWTSAQDPVDVGLMQQSLRSLPIALRVMIGGPGLSPVDLQKLRDEVLLQAKADIAASNSLLADNRTGIQMTPAGTATINVAGKVVVNGCLHGDEVTSMHDVANLLNVYYVNGLNQLRGLSCAGHDGPPRNDVIYVAWDKHSPTTLVHELGHALGLTLPRQGHSEILEGFDRTNLMTGGENDEDPGGRRRLTVGQAFRTNADSASWLNRALDGASNLVRELGAPRLACQCGALDPAGRCPRLVDDVARPSGTPQTVQPWDCFDLLRLKNAKEDDVPLAILAGRGWRSPPGTCSTDLPGRTENHFNATYIEVDNLTRPGSCESWAAIFFRNHGVLHVELADSAWGPAADLFQLSSTIPPLVDVDVQVNYPTARQSEVEREVDYATQTFGAQNRSGIHLKLNPLTGPCPPMTNPLPPAPAILVCYTASGNAEASQPGARRILIAINRKEETTLAHYLGRVLGLQPLSSTATAFKDNIMQTDPAQRGQQLTLGQVYRINVPLNTALPACAVHCPSLAADVRP
jgi:hypothetical protein